MTTLELIHEIEDHIDRLTQARALLRSSSDHWPLPGALITVSSDGITTAHLSPPITFPMPTPAPAGKPDLRRREHRTRQLSPTAKDRISQAQKKRWRKFHREKKLAAKMRKEKVA